MFGPHLTLDLYGCPASILSDLNHISSLLDKFPDQLGMTKIMPPYVFKYEGAVKEDWGITGVVLIAESHISVHSFPDSNFAVVDVFSCKDFDIQHAINTFQDAFNASYIEERLMYRGEHYKTTRPELDDVLILERNKVK